MGLISGLLRTALAPVEIAVKTIDSAVSKDWEFEDLMTLGATKVLKETIDVGEEVLNEFDG